MRDTLHWLPLRQRIFYKVAVLVWHCLLGGAPVYLQELCRPVSTLVGRQALRSFFFWWQTLSSQCKQLHYYAASFVLNCCSFYLPSQIRLLPKSYTPLLYKLLKTDLHRGWTGS